MKTLDIEIDGIALKVTGVFHKGYGPSWSDPGERDSFEVYALTDSGVDVLHLHDEDEIEALALEVCGADDEYDRDYAADMRREDARLGMR
ncbi:hypothetical protein E5S69_31665 [Cupriavidus necator]|uniref:hypothetical protein n=1 Tax=Cupriavidus necator TaxID=106590 RepID=UPI00148FC647|nr:hypothetical protein [Cupriavidus necator]NOV28046.1 hypothetical protein [Cupriavidus necator]